MTMCYLMSVWLLSLLGASWGVEVELGRIKIFDHRDDNAYLDIIGTVEGYSMEITCTNCIKVEGTRIYCEYDKLVAIMVGLRKGDQHFLVPFNASCDKREIWTRHINRLRDMTTISDSHSMRISWKVLYRSTDRYIIYYMWEGKYNHIVVTTRRESYVLEGLKERTRYRICVAAIDQRSQTGKYTCRSQETDSLETGPVEEVKVISSIDSVSLSWKRPKTDLYDPSGYIVDYRESPGGSCGRIVIRMGTSGGTPQVGDLQGCTQKRQYTWESLQPLTIGGLRPYTDYIMTILPVNRGKRQVPATERVRTKEGGSGPVANLRTSIIGGYLRVEYDPPQQPNGIVTKYKVKVVLRRGGICDKVEDRILRTYQSSSTYKEVPLEDLTRCGHHVIEVAAVNGYSLDGGVGKTSSVTFDYKPDASLAISTPVARPVSSNMVQISWVHHNLKEDCPKTGFLVEVANKGRPSDCVSQIIYDGGCPQLDDMLRRVISCHHNETRNVAKDGPSWVLNIWGSFRPSETYEVKIWKISDQVLSQKGPPSISFEDQGCFTDCYGSTYVGVRSHRECVTWKDSKYKTTHPSRVDSICTLKDRPTPWCGTKTGYTYCDVPRCSLVVRATGCVQDVQEVTGTNKVTLRWTPPPLGSPPIGYIIMLHLINGICERSHLQMCDACGDEASLTNGVRSFLVSCGSRSVTKGVLHRTTFDNLHQNRPYRVYIVPLVNVSISGEVRNISIRTLMAKPGPPKNLRMSDRSLSSLTFSWENASEAFNHGPPYLYEVSLTKERKVIKTVSLKTENATFLKLEMCTEYCVNVTGVNPAGRSKAGGSLCHHTLSPSLGKVEVDDIDPGLLGTRIISWKYLGARDCPLRFRVVYRNKYLKTELYKETSGTNVTLEGLDRNMVYTLQVRAQADLATVDGAKVGRFSTVKEFYTGTVIPKVYGFKREISIRKRRIRMSLAFDQDSEGSAFEFILQLKAASGSCLLAANFTCPSCPPPYRPENLDPWIKTQREELMDCLQTFKVNFHRDDTTIQYVLPSVAMPNETFMEIFVVNLVGVHEVYRGDRKNMFGGTPTQFLGRWPAGTVVFFVGSKEDNIKVTASEKPLLFERVLTNVGGGYSNITGVFTAPVRGVYLFVARMCLRGDKRVVRLIKENEHVWSIGSVRDHEVTLEVRRQERVWLQIDLDGGQGLFVRMCSYWSGRLIVAIDNEA